MEPTRVATFGELEDREPIHAPVGNVDLVAIRYDNQVSVLYGRCLHRGALLADGRVAGANLICGVHEWDYRIDSGISEYQNDERLAKFDAWIDGDGVYVDADQIAAWESANPQPFKRDEYQGAYQDVHGTPVEPDVAEIRELAAHGLGRVGHHGPVSAMGVPRNELPS